jgi:hypothetical protein
MESAQSIILDALANWILRVTDDRSLVTPEAVAALPEVAKVYFMYQSHIRELGDSEGPLKSGPGCLNFEKAISESVQQLPDCLSKLSQLAQT